MLCLTRGVGQRIRIGDDITITVGAIRMGPDGQSVKLVIDAPREVRVDREEVRERIKAERETGVHP